MNNAKPQQPLSTIFSIALSIGLLLGLFVGWVLWPVEWEGATLRDLDTPAQAEYLAAVADAFVIYSDPEAAEIAWRRLQGFQPDVQQAFNDAILYFRDSQQPERAIRISNLGRLASAIGLVPPTLAAIDPPAADQAAELVPLPTPATDATGTTVTDSTQEGDGWVRWLLWLLVLLLIGGGLYLLSTFMGGDSQAWLGNLRAQIQRWRSQLGSRATLWRSDTLGDDEFTEEDYAVGAGSSLRSAQMTGRHLVTADDDLSFEDEDADESNWRAASARPGDTGYRRDAFTVEEQAMYRRPALDPTQGRAKDDFDGDPDDLDPDDFEDDFGAEHFAQDDDDAGRTAASQPRNRFTVTAYDLSETREDEEDEDSADAGWDDDQKTTPAPPKSAPPTRLAGHDRARDDAANEEDEEDGAEEEHTDEDEHTSPRAAPPSVPLARHREPAPAASAVPLPAQRTRYKILEQHTLQYRVGMQEYDESKAILDPAAGKYIGEFGMGVSTKNALVQTGPDQVVALEVWLFDKSDERSIGQQTRILLSEYAVEKNLEQVFLKERQDNPRPFTAQNGVHFQLESQNLLLDCVIVEVKYAQSGAAKGIFHSIKVEMTAQQKR